MSPWQKAFVGARIHDGADLFDRCALVVTEGGGAKIQPETALTDSCRITRLEGGLIAPGFVDLQVNGGGGVMFNDDPSVDTLRRIAAAHATTGTTALLPTLITDTPERTRAAIDSAEAAIRVGVAGIVGLHLEGPHLSVARKGAHDPALIRPMEDADLALLLDAARRLPTLMVTVAPESVSPAQIATMAEAGIVVSLGHTDADHATCHAAFDAGARCVTHLFNAMSQLTSRAPGLVGATLGRADVHAGLIADGHHVDPASIRVALAAKPRSDRIFLVTDAMAPAASSMDRFTLNGREVTRRDGRLTLGDGTLAGADLSMARAISVMTGAVGESLSQSISRATSIPAALLRGADGVGRIDRTTQRVNYFPDIESGDPACTSLSLAPVP